jgi:hypothetical protein
MHWAPRNTGLISDFSCEGRIQPDQWGTLIVPAEKWGAYQSPRLRD